MKVFKMLLVSSLLVLTSCAELMKLSQNYTGTNAPLTSTEIGAGLKEALIQGTDKSADILSVTDGYYNDDLVKILLPPEADIIVENINKIPGGSLLIDDLLLKINRSAEDAAKEVKPIFVDAITDMTIADAIGILNGDDDAATQYLRSSTYQDLLELYTPYISASVEKNLIGDISTKDSWDQLTSVWNALANSIVGQLAGYEPVEVELDHYLTQKALDGLFLKVADEEMLIRQDPLQRTSELLKRVFGSRD